MAEESFQQYFVTNLGKAAQSDIDVTHCKVKVADVKWTKNGQYSTVASAPVNGDITAQLAAKAQETDRSPRLRITEGSMKGFNFNKRVNVEPPKECGKDFPKIAMNLSHADWQDPGLGVEFKAQYGESNVSSNQGANAKVNCESKFYDGHFTGTAKMSGNALCDGTSQDVKDINVPGTTKDGKYRVWQIKGEASFKYDEKCKIKFK